MTSGCSARRSKRTGIWSRSRRPSQGKCLSVLKCQPQNNIDGKEASSALRRIFLIYAWPSCLNCSPSDTLGHHILDTCNRLFATGVCMRLPGGRSWCLSAGDVSAQGNCSGISICRQPPYLAVRLLLIILSFKLYL